MGDIIDFWGDEQVRGEPDSPLYEVRFSKLIIFVSLEQTRRLLKVYGHEAELGTQVLECKGGIWYKRSLHSDEQNVIVEGVTISK